MWGLLCALMTVRASLVSPAQGWLYEEADFFCRIVPFSVEQIENYVVQLGQSNLFSRFERTVINASREGLSDQCRPSPELFSCFMKFWQTRHVPVAPPMRSLQSCMPALGSTCITGETVVKQALAPAAGKKRPGVPGPAPKVPRAACGALPSLDPETANRRSSLVKLVADEAWLQSAVQELRDSMFAMSTWNGTSSAVKLYRNLCESAKIAEPFPMTRASLTMFTSAIKKHGYASGTIKTYVCSLFRQQILLWLPIDPDLRDWRSFLFRATDRGTGDAHHMHPLTMKHLVMMREHVKGTRDMFLFRMMVVTWFFLLRSDESVGSATERGLTHSSFDFDIFSKRVSVILGVTKTNHVGLKCVRTLECVCQHGEPTLDGGVTHDRSERSSQLPLCPYCAAKRLCDDSLKVQPNRSEPLRPADGSKAPTSANLLYLIRTLLVACMICVVDGEGRFIFGTHSLRRGAAQALVMAGYSMDAIKFFGRWLSSAVELYLLTCPISSFGGDIAAGMSGVVSMWPTKLSGAEPDEKVWHMDRKSVFLPPQSHARAKVRVGSKLRLTLPHLLRMDFLSPEVKSHLDCDDDMFELPEGPSSDPVEASVVALLPSSVATLPGVDMSILQYDDSVVSHVLHPADDLMKYSPDDRCVIVRFPAEKLQREFHLVVSLKRVPFSVLS